MVTVHPATRQPYQTVARGTPIDHVAVIGDSYTTGTDQGGWGSNTWTNRTWLTRAHQGVEVAPEVASEGRAGYVVRGDHGIVFEDLTNRAVHPDDALVVFFGSRNDHGVDPAQMAAMAHDTLDLARRIAPSAKLLVIGPPWTDSEPPIDVLYIRDILSGQANVHRPGRRRVVRRQARPDRPRRRAPERRRARVHGREDRSIDPRPAIPTRLIRHRLRPTSVWQCQETHCRFQASTLNPRRIKGLGSGQRDCKGTAHGQA